MTNFGELLKLLKEEKGKVFVLDSEGNLQLVIMSSDEYLKVKSGKSEEGNKSGLDVEDVNRQITQAQLEDEVPLPIQTASVNAKKPGFQSIGSVIDTWHQKKHTPQSQASSLQEVIDPSWDEDGLGFSV